jgi:dTDP-glucose 4,6-dehydratase
VKYLKTIVTGGAAFSGSHLCDLLLEKGHEVICTQNPSILEIRSITYSTLQGEKGARFLLASTSEVYGDPLVNPQPDEYWSNVNPVGPCGVSDEAKRYAEAITM